MASQMQEKGLSPTTHDFVGLLFDMDRRYHNRLYRCYRQALAQVLTPTNKRTESRVPRQTLTARYRIGEELGLDPAVILQTSHGRRSIDVLKVIAPEKANWEYVCGMEGVIPRMYGEGAVEIPGARSLLDSLNRIKMPWAIVTSGTRPLVTGWLDVLKLPSPENLVVAEDVPNGKPDPTCYLMGKKLLGLENTTGDILVLEDSPAGIRAGKAAGCKVLGVVTTHKLGEVIGAGADWVVKDLESVRVVGNGNGGVKLEFSDVLNK